MTYIPRREITRIIPNKFEAIRVLALECRRLNDELRAREETEIEGKLTTLAVKQMLEGKVTYYDAKERREQERSEAMLSAAEGLLDIDEPVETEYELGLQESGELPVTAVLAEPVAKVAAQAALAEPVAPARLQATVARRDEDDDDEDLDLDLDDEEEDEEEEDFDIDEDVDLE